MLSKTTLNLEASEIGVGLVSAFFFFLREMTESRQKKGGGGKRILGGGSKNVFGEVNLRYVFHPPEFSTPLDRSLTGPLLAAPLSSCPSFGSHLRTLALKTENFSKKKSVVLVQRENGFTKTLFSLFFQGFLPRGWF